MLNTCRCNWWPKLEVNIGKLKESRDTQMWGVRLPEQLNSDICESLFVGFSSRHIELCGGL